MGKIQIIESPGGDRFAVVPLAEYERLQAAAEMLEDVSAYDAAKRALAAGEEELVPQEIANADRRRKPRTRLTRLSRCSRARTCRGGGSKSRRMYRAQIESGQRDGNFDTMQRIAEALKVSLDDLRRPA